MLQSPSCLFTHMFRRETDFRRYLNHEADVVGEALHAVEAGDETDLDPALLVHFAPQEEVALEVLFAEVVVTEAKASGIQLTH